MPATGFATSPQLCALQKALWTRIVRLALVRTAHPTGAGLGWAMAHQQAPLLFQTAQTDGQVDCGLAGVMRLLQDDQVFQLFDIHGASGLA